MYNLLLVDDEVLIADGMYDALCEENRESLNPIKAYDGAEALKIASEKRIDILLTDINMPDIDGFGLYERIAALWPYCRVIFLTGFQSFDYAYKAIQYKNIRYIIKAEGVDRVLGTVREVIEELDNALLQKMQSSSDPWRESGERLLRELLIEYFNGEIEEEELRKEDPGQPGVCPDWKRPFYLAGAKFDTKARTAGYKERLEFIKDINVLLKSHLADTFRVIPIDLNQGMMWLIQTEDREERDYSGYLMNVFDLFQVHLKSAFDLESVVVVCRAAGLAQVKREFHQLHAMLRSQMLTEGNLLTYEELRQVMQSRNRADRPGISADIVKQRIPRLARLLEAQDRDGFLKEAEPVFEALGQVKSRHSLQAEEVYLSISLCMLEYISQTGLYEKLPFELSLAPLTNPGEFAGWNDAVEYLRRLAEAIFRINEEKSSDEIHLVVQRIEQLIEENIENDVSITSLAQKLYFNSYYLSRMFKAAKGVKLSDYITERKMERARKLLTESDYKVQTIGERMGYSSPANFIRSFKKYCGLTPNEYRRMYYSRKEGI